MRPPAIERSCGSQPIRTPFARVTLPSSISCSPAMTLSSVVLPEPFGPIRPIRSPWPRRRLTSLEDHAIAEEQRHVVEDDQAHGRRIDSTQRLVQRRARTAAIAGHCSCRRQCSPRNSARLRWLDACSIAARSETPRLRPPPRRVRREEHRHHRRDAARRRSRLFLEPLWRRRVLLDGQHLPARLRLRRRLSAGQYCTTNHTCVAGCSVDSECGTGEACCGNTCKSLDTLTDCGSCGNACADGDFCDGTTATRPSTRTSATTRPSMSSTTASPPTTTRPT